jgi:protein PhnA
MDAATDCPQCGSKYPYQDGQLWICPECAHEWSVDLVSSSDPKQEEGVKDANGNLLMTGDTITLIKDLKVKGSSSTVKTGIKIKNIRLVDHNSSA